MIPVVTPAEMAAIDAAAPEPVDVLVDRAARAVARTAIDMMGGTYGRRVVVVAGPGNNGADGRVAAAHLERRGVQCRVIEAGDDVGMLAGVDLVIDAAFGTGLSRPYSFPTVPEGVPVLAVDIPSGVDGLSGARLGPKILFPPVSPNEAAGMLTDAVVVSPPKEKLGLNATTPLFAPSVSTSTKNAA